MTNVLFICSQNKLRSPTAESVFCDVPGWDVRSAGLNNDAEVRISSEDIIWAEYIFVMEQAHTRKLKKKYKSNLNKQHIICLGIPDDYDYMDEGLVSLLKNKVPQFIS